MSISTVVTPSGMIISSASIATPIVAKKQALAPTQLLSDDILSKLFPFSKPSELLLSHSHVCKKWRNFIDTKEVWYISDRETALYYLMIKNMKDGFAKYGITQLTPANSVQNQKDEKDAKAIAPYDYRNKVPHLMRKMELNATREFTKIKWFYQDFGDWGTWTSRPPRILDTKFTRKPKAIWKEYIEKGKALLEHFNAEPSLVKGKFTVAVKNGGTCVTKEFLMRHPRVIMYKHLRVENSDTVISHTLQSEKLSRLQKEKIRLDAIKNKKVFLITLIFWSAVVISTKIACGDPLVFTGILALALTHSGLLKLDISREKKDPEYDHAQYRCNQKIAEPERANKENRERLINWLDKGFFHDFITKSH